VEIQLRQSFHSLKILIEKIFMSCSLISSFYGTKFLEIYSQSNLFIPDFSLCPGLKSSWISTKTFLALCHYRMCTICSVFSPKKFKSFLFLWGYFYKYWKTPYSQIRLKQHHRKCFAGCHHLIFLFFFRDSKKKLRSKFFWILFFVKNLLFFSRDSEEMKERFFEDLIPNIWDPRFFLAFFLSLKKLVWSERLKFCLRANRLIFI